MDRLSDLAATVRTLKPSGRRVLVAIAGPPASGKSTLAAKLVGMLNADGGGAVLVPMDGFHLDNGILSNRNLLPRKGAPETFDGAGFVHAIRRLGDEPEVILPTFDRGRDISIAGAIAIGPEHRIAVVEGNYLCFDEDPWRALGGLWDYACYLAVPEPILRERLIRRWLDHGLSQADAEARAEGNDLANALRIAAKVARVDLTL